MNKNSQNIENMFKQKFQNLEIRPEKRVWRSIDNKMWISNFKYYIEKLFKHETISTNDKIWRNINRKLWLQDYLSFRLAKFNIYYSSLIFVGLTFLLFHSPELKKNLISNKFTTQLLKPFSNDIEKPFFGNSEKPIKVKKTFKAKLAILNNNQNVIITKSQIAFNKEPNIINGNKILNKKISPLKKNIANELIYTDYELFKNKISSEIKSKKWTFDIYTNINEPNQINDINTKNKKIKSEMIGLSVSYTINNFIIETGIAIGNTTDLVLKNDTVFKNKLTNYFIVDSINFNQNDSLTNNYFAYTNFTDLSFKYDSSLALSYDTTSISQILNSKNQYKTIEIPIMFGYQIAKGNFNCAIKGGLISALYYKQEDKMIFNDNQPSRIKHGHALVKADFSFTLALGLEYKLDKNISLITEPFYRKTLNSIFANETRSVQRYNSYGLKLGVRYTL